MGASTRKCKVWNLGSLAAGKSMLPVSLRKPIISNHCVKFGQVCIYCTFMRVLITGWYWLLSRLSCFSRLNKKCRSIRGPRDSGLWRFQKSKSWRPRPSTFTTNWGAETAGPYERGRDWESTQRFQTRLWEKWRLESLRLLWLISRTHLEGVIHCAAERRPDVAEKVRFQILNYSYLSLID